MDDTTNFMLWSDLSPDNGNQDDNTEWEAEGGSDVNMQMSIRITFS